MHAARFPSPTKNFFIVSSSLISRSLPLFRVQSLAGTAAEAEHPELAVGILLPEMSMRCQKCLQNASASSSSCRPESEDVGQEEGESSVVVEPPDVDEPGVGLVGEHLDAGHVLRRDEVAVVPAEHGDLQVGFGEC